MNPMQAYNKAKVNMLLKYNEGMIAINEKDISDEEKNLLIDIHDTRTITELIMLCSAQYAFIQTNKQLADFYEFCNEIQVEINLQGKKNDKK